MATIDTTTLVERLQERYENERYERAEIDNLLALRRNKNTHKLHQKRQRSRTRRYPVVA